MDPSMFVLTAGVLDLEFAVAKTVAALGLGGFGGLVVHVLFRGGALSCGHSSPGRRREENRQRATSTWKVFRQRGGNRKKQTGNSAAGFAVWDESRLPGFSSRQITWIRWRIVLSSGTSPSAKLAMNRTDLARQLTLSVDTLQRREKRGMGPPCSG